MPFWLVIAFDYFISKPGDVHSNNKSRQHKSIVFQIIPFRVNTIYIVTNNYIISFVQVNVQQSWRQITMFYSYLTVVSPTQIYLVAYYINKHLQVGLFLLQHVDYRKSNL